MANMKNISKETGVEFVIDTQRQWIARMKQGNNKVFFNPIYTQSHIQAIADKRRQEEGIEEEFVLDVNHLSAIVLHEINHMINHNDLVQSKRTVTIDGKVMTMIELQQYCYKKYGSDFQKFENILEDIDVNHHATRLQAPVYESSKQDIYRHICAPSSDLTQEPLSEQFAWTILRESMIDESCKVDPLIRSIVNNIWHKWGVLEIIRDPSLKYDEQFLVIKKLYEDYYLKLKEKQEKPKDSHPEWNEGTSQNNNPLDDEWKGDKWDEKDREKSDSGSKSPEWQNQDESPEWQGKDKEGKWQEWDNDASSCLNSNEERGAEWNEGEWKDQWTQEDSGSTSSEWQGKKNEGKWQGESKNPPRPSLLPHIFDNPEWPPDTNQQLLDALNNQNKDKDSGSKSPEWHNESKIPLSEASAKDGINIQNALLDQIQKADKEKNKTDADRRLEVDIEREFGFTSESDPKAFEKKKKEILQYTTLEEKIKQIKNRQGDKVYDKIVNEIFHKIIQIRKRPEPKEIAPRNFSEGGVFDNQSLIGGIMSMRAGDDDPRIMRQDAKKEKITKKAGAFNITLIGDGSGSMQWQKNIDQKLNFLLLLTALDQLNHQLSANDLWLIEDLKIQVAALMFQWSDKIKTVKERWSTRTMADKLKASKALDYAWASTENASDAIRQYYNTVSTPLPGEDSETHRQRLEDIKSGKIKEICIVMADGEFTNDDKKKTQTLTAQIREMGIIVCGIGITKDGAPMIDIFWSQTGEEEHDAGGFWLVCEQTADLWDTLNDLLLYHLSQEDMIWADG